MTKRIDVLSVPVDVISRPALIGRIDQLLRDQGPAHLMAMNAIKVVRARREPELREYIERATVLYADGIGICIALRMLHGIRQEQIAGCDLFYDVLEAAARQRRRVFFVGASPEVVRITVARLKQRYPDLIVAGWSDGYVGGDRARAVLEQMKAAQAEVVFVAMGALLQERFIERVRAEVRPILAMGLGGTFDVVAGIGPGAPRWALRLGVLWLYRLLRQPHRAWRMRALPVFALLVAGEKARQLRAGR